MNDIPDSNQIPVLTQTIGQSTSALGSDVETSVVVEHIAAVAALHDDQNIVEVIMRLINDEAIVFSDILVHEGRPITIRQTKRMTEATEWSVTREHMENLFEKLNQNWQVDIQSRAFDRALDLTNCRLRVNCFKFLGGKKLGAAIRINPPEPRTFEEIGLPQNAIDLATLESGLILVVGDTCQGKSTTLASMIDSINKSRSGHIITAEDPIETVIPDRMCIVTQREVGRHADIESYYAGALDALRERPDVIMFGEIRESETAEEALQLAESGPLVLASLHARTPEQAIIKYLRLLGEEKHHRKAFSSALRGIICQSLVPTVEGDRYVLATEVLRNDSTFSAEIEQENYKSIRQKLQTVQESIKKSSGSHTMNSVLIELFDAGKITREDALKASTDRDKLHQTLIQRSSPR